MLENCRNAKERWGGVSDIIDKWLKERRELIVQFCDITASNGALDSESKFGKFKTLCQILVDYVSAGHFEVYEQLLNEAREFDDGGIELVSKLIPRIQKTTEYALDFNDRFDNVDKVDDGLNKLSLDMAQLGQILEERFELEDALIEALHNAHADQVA